jgi:hypothetical protein
LNRRELTGAGTDTQLGVVIGTLDYMSDEQRSGGEVDSRTDVYALGRTAVRMLFGELPEHSDWARWSGSHVNPELSAVLTRAFAPRDLRYGTAGELSRDLTKVLGSGPPGADSTWLDRARRWSRSAVTSRRVQIGAAVVAGLAVIGVAAASLARRPQSLPPTNTISIVASPAAVKFDAVGDSIAPSSQEVQITSGVSDTATLSVGGVQYDSSAANWLGPATWRDGKATVPAVLVLTPIPGATPGVHTARVSITAPSAITPTIVTATLTVRAPDAPPAPNGGGVDPCVRPRQQLATIRKLTDPLSGTPDDARRVLTMVPPLVASLCAPGEKVEAQLRLAEAHMTLQQTSRACEVLRSIQAEARKSSFAENVRVLLTNCP